MGSSSLPHGFSVWGFIDIEGTDFSGSDREELSRYFLEIDLKKKLWNSGGLIAEYNDLQGEANAIGRLGVYYQPKIACLSPQRGWLSGKGTIAFKVFPIESDRQGWQASFNWNKKFENLLGGRLSAGGFFDLNIDTGPLRDTNRIVTEHQIRIQLKDDLQAIVEFRFNGFLDSEFGIAPGVQYKF